MGFHGFSWEMVWLRFPAICFIDGGMQPLLQAMNLKACKSVSKSALLLVNQDLALKTSSFFHWYSCWKFSWGYFNLSSLYGSHFGCLHHVGVSMNITIGTFKRFFSSVIKARVAFPSGVNQRGTFPQKTLAPYFQVMSPPWKNLVDEYVLTFLPAWRPSIILEILLDFFNTLSVIMDVVDTCEVHCNWHRIVHGSFQKIR